MKKTLLTTIKDVKKEDMKGILDQAITIYNYDMYSLDFEKEEIKLYKITK